MFDSSKQVIKKVIKNMLFLLFSLAKLIFQNKKITYLSIPSVKKAIYTNFI